MKNGVAPDDIQDIVDVGEKICALLGKEKFSKEKGISSLILVLASCYEGKVGEESQESDFADMIRECILTSLRGRKLD